MWQSAILIFSASQACRVLRLTALPPVIHLSRLSVTMAIGHDTNLGPETGLQKGGKVGQR